MTKTTVHFPIITTGGHYLTARRSLFWAATQTRVTVDSCRCGTIEIGIGIGTQPIRVHLTAELGHAVEYTRIGPEITDTGAAAVTIGCVCGTTFRLLDDMETAKALHASHAEGPQPLVIPAQLTAAY